MDMTTKFIPLRLVWEGKPVLVEIDENRNIAYKDTISIEKKVKENEEKLIKDAFRAECPERRFLGEGFFHTSFGENYAIEFSRNHKG